MIDCGLALTGSGPWLVPLLIAVALVGIGLALRLRPKRVVIAVLVTVAFGALLTFGPSPAAQAADCGTAVNSLTIRQTSTMTGLMPGRAPALISGTVTNNGPDETTVDAIVVSIARVSTRFGAAAGTCGAADFTLLDSRMTVAQNLAPGASTTFTGASIAFRSGPTNQDACKGSTVHLAYTTAP